MKPSSDILRVYSENILRSQFSRNRAYYSTCIRKAFLVLYKCTQYVMIGNNNLLCHKLLLLIISIVP